MAASFKSVGGLVGCLLLGFLVPARAQPATPRPPAYFNDYARLVRPATAQSLNRVLEQFERETSNQILVVTYPRLPAGAAVEDTAVRLAQSWGVGQKGRDNGAVLFVFSAEHQLTIETGYGLEGALPDAICKRIIGEEIVPRFRQGDPDGGLTAGVQAMLAAARGEYHGSGRTVAEGRSRGIPPGFAFLIFILIIVVSVLRSRRHVVYGRGGRTGAWGGTPWIFPGGGGGGGWSGGGGGGGGFSGGGGSFGGGGAGGSW